jgi:mannose-6-phosphate isomerase
MKEDRKVFTLQGKIQHYAWGGSSYLPQLLRLANPEGRPFAEYWLGAHDNAPAAIEGGALNEVIQKDVRETLGAYTAGRFRRLPYLLKILDVKNMLSIQVHPTKQNAELEFAAENKRGVPLNAAERNYKDDNHKPELMTPLSEMWLLHGFKPKEQLMETLESVPELAFLTPLFATKGYQGLYQTVMEMPQAEVNAVLEPLLKRILPEYDAGELKKDQEHFWAARAARTYDQPGRIDRGIFSIYFFNLLNMYPGEAIFQDAGQPHAYLEGQNVEIMANSDNVLRGGLTPKHVDVPELLKHIRFEPTHPRIQQEKDDPGPITVFKTPAPDFELSKIRLSKGESLTIKAHSAEIFIVTDGRTEVVEADANPINRKAGESFIAFCGATVDLNAQEDTIIFRAAVPAGTV